MSQNTKKDVPTGRGIWKVGSGLPGYIFGKEASILDIKKEQQISRLKLQKGYNDEWSFIFTIQSKIKLKKDIS